MNPYLDTLHPYPFERFNALLKDADMDRQPDADMPLIAWSMGEPRHPAPGLVLNAFTDSGNIKAALSTYPATGGLPALRGAISKFITRRYGLAQPIDPDREVLPVNGTREALFAMAQVVIDPSEEGITIMPNPFYQIYEGAALLAGSKPCYLNCVEDNNFLPDFAAVDEATWAACQLVYICSPGNPGGAVMPLEQLTSLIALSDQFNFVIASDECYSEIYQDEATPPPGILEAAVAMGRTDYRNCIAFNSLSKRSNLPGLRSGYVAGDARILARFLQYRTYHGSAMPIHHQIASIAAWQDEDHVIANRQVYRAKFTAVTDLLADVWPMTSPPAGFYLWPKTPIKDTDFTLRLLRFANVKVLPGSFLSRDTCTGNPGNNRVRIALVATETECIEAACRIRDCWPALIKPDA